MSQQNSGTRSGAKSEIAAWYVSRAGDATGPFSTDMLLAMIRNQQLQSLDLVFREGEVEWKPVATFRELKTGQGSVGATSGTTGKPEVPQENLETRERPATPQGSGYMAKGDPRTLSWIVLRPHNSTYLQEGPLETQTIIEGLEKGRFQFSQYAWHAGMSQWMRIGDLREFDRRSRSRDSKPHVPPPLPDPIEAVLLEDDKDLEAEEFQVNIRGNLKHDLTPNPLESMQAMNITQLGKAAIGGAAAESPEQKASRAVSLAVSSGNLAGVPWEQDPSDGYAQAVELIDDQHSGIHGANTRSDLFDGDDNEAFTFTGSIGGAAAPEERFEKTPPPFIPQVPVVVSLDHWEKWGRHTAGAGMFALAALFTFHLSTYQAPPAIKIARMKPNEASVAPIAAVTSGAEPAPLAAPAPGVSAPGVSAPPTAVSDQMDAGPEKLPAVTVASVKPPLTAPTVPTNDLSIVGIKLDRPDGQIVVQGTVPLNTPLKVSFKGRLGQVLSKISVRKEVTVHRKGGELPTVKLKDLRLPAGSYTVEVSAGEAKAKNEVFIGHRDAKFLSALEAHLRAVSLETQTQKKVLFYAAQEMNVLARDLGQNYGQLRGKPEQWSTFLSHWKQRMETVNKSLGEVQKKSVEDQAYPEETASLLQAQISLKEVAAQYEQAIGQSRDMASDTLTDLISELSRQKDIIGQATARPTADTPDGVL